MLQYTRAVACLTATIVGVSLAFAAPASAEEWDLVDEEKAVVYLVAFATNIVLVPINAIDIVEDEPDAVKGIMGIGFGIFGIYAGGLAISEGANRPGAFLVGLGAFSAMLGGITAVSDLKQPIGDVEVRPDAVASSGRLHVGLAASINF